MKNNFFKKHGSLILTILSAAGVVGTGIAVHEATKKEDEILQNSNLPDPLDDDNVLKEVTHLYIKSMAIGTGTIFCIFGIHRLNRKQQAALISGYNLIAKTLQDYRQETIKRYGEETDRDIVKTISLEHKDDVYIYSDSLTNRISLQVDDDSEERLFYDVYSKRYFNAKYSDVLIAESNFARNYVLRGDACINEFYQFLGIPEVSYGDDVGFNISSGILYLDFNNIEQVYDDGLKCVYIEFDFSPESGYLDE